MAMGQRGRRQVLQLDDVSSSHPARHHHSEPKHNQEQRDGSSNPLLSLVGQYNSGSSSDEDDDKTDEEVEERKESRIQTKHEEEAAAESGDVEDSEESRKDAETLAPKEVEPRTSDTLQGIPLPAPSAGGSQPPPLPGGAGSSIDSEVASFLAEIESISKDQKPDTEESNADDHSEAVDSSQVLPADIGFIPKPDASIPATTEDPRESRPAFLKEEKASKPSSSEAYRSMFVKGAVEFAKKERDEEKKTNGAEMEEELPEEPVSEWQMVQDDATQYYYYWNTVTNQVTWEIPPGYTQFLLRYKEYEERIAKIPKDKLQRMKERKEQKKKHGSETKRDSSPAPSSSETRHRSKHKKEKRRKETSEAASSDVPIGPQLPPARPETAHGEVKTNSEKKEDTSVPESKAAAHSKKKAEDVKMSTVPESAVDSTSVETTDVEAIFNEALAAVAKGSKEVSSSQNALPVPVTTSSVDSPVLVSSVDVTKSAVSVDSSADSSKAVVSMDTDSASGATAAASAAVVSSSSVVSSIAVMEKEVKDTGAENGEAVVTNSGVNDDAANEEDDDFDMDFDDIDDLDRALEKALEKKLEKKKAELENLERTNPESPADPAALLSAPPMEPSQSETARPSAAKPLSPSDPESAVSSSMKTIPEVSVSSVPTHKTSPPVSSVSTSVNGDTEAPGTSGVRPKSSKSKRSAVESSTADETEQQEPTGKKARLVAYDAQTDDESMDTSDEVSTSPAKAAKQPSNEADGDLTFDILPTPPPEKADNLSEIQEMADTAFAKLAFLDVTSEGLSPLQISLIQLQTRLTDWQEGGLIGEYFYQRLREVNSVLKHYESSAVPAGWTCQWDSNFRRYFYTNAHTGQPQWDYPQGEAVDAPASTSRKSKKGKGSKKKKVKVIGPEPAGVSILEATSLVLAETGGDGTAEGSVVDAAETEKDLDGTAMEDQGMSSEKLTKAQNGSIPENQPSASAAETTTATTAAALPDSGDSVQTALQSLFPGEPLPPGTELLLGLPPPPPPPLPPDDTPTTTEDAYVCADDSSDESVGKEEQKGEEKSEVKLIDPDIDGEELVEEEEGEEEEKRKEKEEEETGEVERVSEDPAVISRPPQLRFPAAVSSSAPHDSAATSSASSTVSAPHVRSAAPVLHAAVAAQPDSASSLTAPPAIVAANSPQPSSPKEDGVKAVGSPAPASEASSSTSDHHHKQDKHKKKKKEKLGSHTMSLKKKGVSSLVQKWQKVKKEVEQEERANEKRQQAIRQQLEEWKKENS